MAYWLTDLQKAVLTRLQADTGSGGLLNTSAPLISSVWCSQPVPADSPWWELNSKSPEDPLVVYELEGVGNADTQNSSGKDILLTVYVYVRSESETTDYDPINVGGTILARIEGDWVAQGVGTAPTYGLDRYSSGALTGGYQLAAPGWQLESVANTAADSWWEWTMVFSASVHKAGA